MSHNNTDIQVKRSEEQFADLLNQPLEFGEPLFIDNTTHDSEGKLPNTVKAYMVIGRKLDKTSDLGTDPYPIDVERSPVFKAFNKDRVGNFVFYDGDDGSIINEEGDQIPINRITVIEKKISELTSEDAGKYHILAQKEGDTLVYKFTDDRGFFVNSRGIVQGAAWNDYAEYRPYIGDKPEPGRIVCDNGDGEVELASEKYQPCGHIVSDTYGQIIGDDNKQSIPIAVAGRALVYIKQGYADVGDCICAGKYGLGEKMTRQEIANYPDRIVGVVCTGIPERDGRFWVNVK